MNHAEQTLRDWLKRADIVLNGERPSHPKVHNTALYERVLSDGIVGLGEAYMEGWWDCEQPDQLIYKALQKSLDRRLAPLKMLPVMLRAKWVNRQRRAKAFAIGEHHYDLGNDLYTHMLDKRMVYTCAYWQNADTLDQAQEAKLDLTCRKMHLESGMTVLDIGCGWGGLARFAAEKYGVNVVGITVSKEQVAWGMERCQGLPVELRLQDYRDLTGQFDRIVSLGMFEHVGLKNYTTFMRVVNRCLKPDGLFLLHSVGANRARDSVINPWMDKYIFPGAMLPTVRQLADVTEPYFIMEDWHNLGADYDTTLLAWMANVKRNKAALLAAGYDERFYRMWIFYLLCCAASFRARRNQLWQIVYTKGGMQGGYRAVR